VKFSAHDPHGRAYGWRPPQFPLKAVFAFMTGAGVLLAIVNALGVSPRQLGGGLVILTGVTILIIGLAEVGRRAGRG
jgi:hypothetical protein